MYWLILFYFLPLSVDFVGVWTGDFFSKLVCNIKPKLVVNFAVYIYLL